MRSPEEIRGARRVEAASTISQLGGMAVRRLVFEFEYLELGGGNFRLQ